MLSCRRPIGIAIVLICITTGCSSSEWPTPVVFRDGRVDPCARVPEAEQTNRVNLFYATSRRPTGSAMKPTYSNDVSNDLTLGASTVQLGDDDMTFRRLCAISAGKEKVSKMPMTITQMSEVGKLGQSAQEQAWADAINRQLDRTPNKQVNIYVHGCCTDLEPELKGVAPFQQFLGRGGAMIVFSWPSRQAIRLYGGDVDRARESGAQLARLIEYLAKNTKVERINILAYSAGGNAMNQGLIKLRESHAGSDAAALQRELKVGNAVFAGSEIDVQGFARKDLQRFLDLAHDVTIYISDKDSALKLASMFGGGGDRLGAANTDALTREELERLASIQTLHVIDISSVPGPHETDGMKGHGYWYGNEWIMSDILMIFRWNLSPDQRGLTRTPGGKWVFPQDYPSRATQAVLNAFAK